MVVLSVYRGRPRQPSRWLAQRCNSALDILYLPSHAAAALCISAAAGCAYPIDAEAASATDCSRRRHFIADRSPSHVSTYRRLHADGFSVLRTASRVAAVAFDEPRHGATPRPIRFAALHAFRSSRDVSSSSRDTVLPPRFQGRRGAPLAMNASTKASNQAMERTADRRMTRLKEKLGIMKQAERALVRRRSSCSR